MHECAVSLDSLMSGSGSRNTSGRTKASRLALGVAGHLQSRMVRHLYLQSRMVGHLFLKIGMNCCNVVLEGRKE